MKRALEIFVSAWAMLLWSVLATLPTGSTLSLPISFGSEALAVQPDEVLSDPELERRARAISAGLRCLVCQNQSIDDSDAGLARDLRIVVRDRLKAGDSDAAVIDYVVARYGEFVLLRPRFETSTLLLWGAPVLLLFLGGAYVLVAARSGRPVARATELSAEEERRIERLLGERRQPGPASADDGIPSA